MIDAVGWRSCLDAIMTLVGSRYDDEDDGSVFVQCLHDELEVS